MIKVYKKKINTKYYQMVNGFIVALFGKRLGVSHLVEYPKCGGSWIRNMIQSYLGGKEYLYDRLINRFDVIQTHSLYSRRYCRPIVVVRDPRDVFVSFYYHELRQKKDNNFEPSVFQYFEHNPSLAVEEDFANYFKAKLENVTYPVFSYSEFIASWIDRFDICMVRYEDCLTSCEGELIRIIDYLGLVADSDKINEIADYHSFEAETKRRYGTGRKAGESDASKFQRKGISGDWKNHFNEQSCRLSEKYLSDVLYKLKYEKDSTWISEFLSKG